MSRVRPDWTFGWNHDQTTDFPVLKLVFPDKLDILRPTVEPDLAWVVKKSKMNMHSHPDSPASVLIFTPCIHLLIIFVCRLVVSQHTTFVLRWLALDRGYFKSHSASLDDPFNPSQPCLVFKVLFFTAAWLIPLISEPPDMTWITQSGRGGEAGAASVGFPVVPLLRWLWAFSERNSLRCLFLSNSLTSILSATQSSVL
ncbi:hypothetical protein F2Q69_00022761 [Brassica cretica]|uniref:Uncharacterized protein n=1 Tax=Brassica cretica TaxID=69181 RepID=A0A8S9QGB4_BRACR|nr:hypothetical protein F2Q69_00022761 [Brassica cretica]